jgi:hypothetical protein
MYKKYVAINRKSLLIIIGLPDSNRQLSVEFSSAYGLNNEGFFYTKDELVQKALENDHRFNKSFRLAQIDNVDVAEYNARQEISKRQEEVTEINPVVPEGPEVISFDNINEAKDFLVSKGVGKKQIPNPVAIVNRAKELGFTIEIKNIKN